MRNSTESASGNLRSEAGIFVWETVLSIIDILTGEPDVRFMSSLRSMSNCFWKLVYIIDDTNLADTLSELRRYYSRMYAAYIGPIAVFPLWPLGCSTEIESTAFI